EIGINKNVVFFHPEKRINKKTDRRQKTEDRRQKTEDRRQKTESLPHRLDQKNRPPITGRPVSSMHRVCPMALHTKTRHDSM
ncbi:MAG: hypothetical protein ACRC8L_01960, partial [Plesiomonas shigelloides]